MDYAYSGSQVRADAAAASPKVNEEVKDTGILGTATGLLIERTCTRRGRIQDEIVLVPDVAPLHAEIVVQVHPGEDVQRAPVRRCVRRQTQSLRCSLRSRVGGKRRNPTNGSGINRLRWSRNGKHCRNEQQKIRRTHFSAWMHAGCGWVVCRLKH